MQFSRFRFYHPAPALLTMFLVANAANMAIAAISYSLLKSFAIKLTNGETAEIRVLLQLLFAFGVAGFVAGFLTLLYGLRRAEPRRCYSGNSPLIPENEPTPAGPKATVPSLPTGRQREPTPNTSAGSSGRDRKD